MTRLFLKQIGSLMSFLRQYNRIINDTVRFSLSILVIGQD